MPLRRTTRRDRPNRIIKGNQNCLFCDKKILPDYKDTGTISKFVSERAKIVGRAKSGVCARHQRQLSQAIKYARHVAFLPFIVRV